MPEIRNNPNTGPGAGTLCEGPRGPRRCSPAHQQGPGRHYVTARKKWSKELDIVVMKCCYRWNPIDKNGVLLKGYRQRMNREWLEQGPFGDATEKRICDQARVIKKNGWLMEVELEMLKRRTSTTGSKAGLNRNINLLARRKNGEVKSKRKVEKFRFRQRGLGTVLEEVKQRVLAKVTKIERYNERIKQYKQSRLFTIDQKKLFAELNGKIKESNEIPDADQSRVFGVAYGVKVKNIIDMLSG